MSPARQGRGSASAEALDELPETEPWEAEAEEHPSSFDPGVETGYLRRGGRDHDLAPEIGAAPFDPGPDHYDDRRARRRARRAEKAERKRRKQEERRREAAERERERREREQREQREVELKALAEREAARERERREAAKRELERAREKRERAARIVAAKRERERVAALERERAAGEEQLRRERRERERLERLAREREQLERERRAHEEAERAELERERRERERAAHLERERRLAAERQHQLQRRREHARREEAERARRAGDARERIERKRAPRQRTPATRPTPSPSPKLRRIPAAATSGPRPRVARPPRRDLRRPTLKAAVALAAVGAAAVGAGALLGLPLPGIGSSTEPGRNAAALGPATEGFTLDGGTPVGLTSGPYFPVVLDAPADFGEGAAKFGADRGGRRHEGQDIFARPGTPLIAVRDGVVLDGAGGNNFYASGGGHTLVIYSPLDDRSYVYLHMLKPPLVRAGDEVRAGQPVGQVGCTGSCFGPHLHFEVRNGRADWGAETKAVDPLPVLRQWPQVPRTQR
jgi:murein DD-endopeptidase MepM/ murein hydrolase activator NlpD